MHYAHRCSAFLHFTSKVCQAYSKIKIKQPNELVALFWSYWPDLNRRPADYESAALPTEPQ